MYKENAAKLFGYANLFGAFSLPVMLIVMCKEENMDVGL
jgi:hypothetical protein